MPAPRSAISWHIARRFATASFIGVALFASLASIACAQEPAPTSNPPGQDTSESPPRPLDSKAPPASPDSPPSSKKLADPDLALKRAVADAQNDRAALVRNLEQYLVQFPDAPRKAAVYRALVESCEQLNDDACALDNAERLVAIHPDDAEMMMVAVNLLEHRGDDQSLTRASGYLTRVLDRVEKTPPAEKSARVSQADWQSQQEQLRVSLYVLRGKIEETQRNYDQAIKDFDASNRLRPNAIAEQHLGTIAELQDNPKGAAEHYLNAFVLPENGPGGAVDRVVIRKNLSNIWKEIHGTDAGLGEATLRAFDRQQAIPQAQSPRDKNKDLKDPFSFTLRQMDGAPFPLAPLRGKVMILSFWATWCGPCRELEPIFAQVAANYDGRTDAAFFAVNVDEDEARAKPFLAEQKWVVKALFADGLDDLLKVIALPTVVILDRNGKIAYRANGYQPEGFAERLTNAVEKAVHSER